MSNSPVKQLSDSNYNPGNRHFIKQADANDEFDITSIESGLRSIGRDKGKELIVFAIQNTARRMLPYGKWVCKDGREVIFNREYQPIYQRVNGVVSFADRNEFVEDIETAEMFWHDANNPVSFMIKHLGYMNLDARDSRACRKSLLKVMTIAREFTPKEHSSVNRGWSLFNALPRAVESVKS